MKTKLSIKKPTGYTSFPFHTFLFYFFFSVLSCVRVCVGTRVGKKCLCQSGKHWSNEKYPLISLLSSDPKVKD